MFDFTKRVKSRNFIRELRKNIFLCQAAKIDRKRDGISSKSFIPKNFQGYCEIEDVNLKRKLKARENTEAQEYSESALSSVRNKNLIIIWLQHKLLAIKLKHFVLMLKLHSLNMNIEKEKCSRRCIISQMPVKLQHSVSTKVTGIKSLKQAIELLKDYHKTLEASNITLATLGYAAYSKCSRDNDIWSSLRTIFSGTPSWLNWCGIFEASQKLSQEIIDVTRFDFLNGKVTRHFEFEILKLRGRFMNLMHMNVIKKREAKRLSQNFPKFHEKFINMFQSQTDPGNIEYSNLEEILAELILKINTQSFHKGQVLCLNKEILSQKAQILRGCQQEVGHQMLVTSTEQIYDEIASHVCQIFFEIESVYHVKEKLSQLKKKLHFTITSVIHKQNLPKPNDNVTGSFEISDVLCSTKVDLENSLVNTTLRFETSTMKNKAIYIAQQVNEVIIFNDLPMDQLKGINCSYYFHCNPLKMDDVYSMSTLQSIPGDVSTFHCLLEEMRLRLKLIEALHKYGHGVVVNQSVSEEKVVAITDNEATVYELVDQILDLSHKTNRKIGALRKCYYFIIGNKMPNFISLDKLFDNRTYADYESEYIMYHSICCKDADQ